MFITNNSKYAPYAIYGVSRIIEYGECITADGGAADTICARYQLVYRNKKVGTYGAAYDFCSTVTAIYATAAFEAD